MTAPPPFRVAGPADGRALRALRKDTAAWLGEIGLPSARTSDVVLAVSELYTNAMQAGARRISVHIDCEDGVVQVEVIDDGPDWRPAPAAHHLPPDTAERGRGLAIAARLGRLAVRRVGGQTRVGLQLAAD